MVCNKCKIDKPIHHFSYRKDYGVYRKTCRSCTKGYKTNKKDWIAEIERLFSLGLKRCGSCHEIKELKMFNVDRNTKTGRTSYCKACVSEVNKKLRKERSITTASSRYGICKTVAKEMYETKHCEICEKPLQKGDKNIDHCHDTGKVRGVLCRSCNFGLGNFKDSISIMEKALLYLKSHRNDTEL